MKKLLTGALALLLVAGCSQPAAEQPAKEEETKEEATEETVEETTEEVAQAELPAPRDTSKKFKPSEDADEENCTEDTFAPGCAAIDSANLLDYLNRDDVLYIDTRDYADYGKKHFRNFECIPFFALIYPMDGGESGNVTQLYSGDVKNPTATYEESDELLEVFFPKDKTIFLMCQSGGRVAMLMNILAAKGYDMSKIYNITGMGAYTDPKYNDIIVDSAEVTLEGTYSFEGLTPAAQ